MKHITYCILLLMIALVGCNQAKESKEVFMFTSFHEPATDGLRLLYSYDGFQWTDLDTTFLKTGSWTKSFNARSFYGEGT